MEVANLFLYFSLNSMFNFIYTDMSWDDYLNPHEQPEYSCSHCEKPMYNDKEYCSNGCWEADMM